MTTQEAIDRVKELTVEYVWWSNRIVASLTDNTVVGINGKASSLLRLRFTVQRIRYIIDEEKLPLKIEVHHSHINSFRVVKK